MRQCYECLWGFSTDANESMLARNADAFMLLNLNTDYAVGGTCIRIIFLLQINLICFINV